MKNIPMNINRLSVFIGGSKSEWNNISFLSSFSSNPHYEINVDGLAPNKQIQVIYDYLKRIGNSQDIFRIHTNSPFVLYAINNCILGYSIKDTYKGKELPSQKAWINPKDVSIWQIERGKVSCIQKEDGTIRKNILTDAMDNLMNEFQEILKYFK